MRSPAVEQAFQVARHYHGNQVDKLGNDYVDGHLTRVWRAVEKYDDQVLSVAAVLHDVLEDTGATRALLLDAGIDLRAIEAIEIVTKRADEKGAPGYERFIARVCKSSNVRAVRLKLADVEDHLLPGTPVELVKRYKLAKGDLGAELGCSVPGHKED